MLSWVNNVTNYALLRCKKFVLKSGSIKFWTKTMSVQPMSKNIARIANVVTIQWNAFFWCWWMTKIHIELSEAAKNCFSPLQCRREVSKFSSLPLVPTLQLMAQTASVVVELPTTLSWSLHCTVSSSILISFPTTWSSAEHSGCDCWFRRSSLHQNHQVFKDPVILCWITNFP